MNGRGGWVLVVDTFTILATDGLGFRGDGANHFWDGGVGGRSRLSLPGGFSFVT